MAYRGGGGISWGAGSASRGIGFELGLEEASRWVREDAGSVGIVMRSLRELRVAELSQQSSSLEPDDGKSVCHLI